MGKKKFNDLPEEIQTMVSKIADMHNKDITRTFSNINKIVETHHTIKKEQDVNKKWQLACNKYSARLIGKKKYITSKPKKTFEVVEPVLDKENNPKWLIENDEQYKLEKPNLWSCDNCGNILNSLNKPIICYQDQNGCGVSATFHRLTKNIDTNLWVLPKWEPNKNINFNQLYKDIDYLVRKCIVFPQDVLYKIFTLWNISTWKDHIWNTVGFLEFLGDIDSGKSRGLDISALLGHRLVQASHMSFPAMVRLSHYFGAGILLDEIQTKLDPKTESGRDYIDFIKPSYRRGSNYVVADKENPEDVVSYKNYGFKALAGEKQFDDAIHSRSIVFMMQQDQPEIDNLKYVEKKFEELRTRLLNYRLFSPDPIILPQDYKIKGRLKEIYASIISTGKQFNIPIEDIENYVKSQKNDQEEKLQSREEYQVLCTLHKYQHDRGLGKPEFVTYDTILSDIHTDWQVVNDHIKLKHSQVLGYILKDLHIVTKRKNFGYVVLLKNEKNERILKYLYKHYGINTKYDDAEVDFDTI